MNLAITKSLNSILLNRCRYGVHRYALSFTTHLLILLFAAVSLTGCGGGATNEANPGAGSTSNIVTAYSGPPASSALVQAYKLEVWDNLVSANRCGNCHSTGGQAPTFVRNDDINQAYSQAITVANLSQPAQSVLVTKVGGGHNCWLPSNSACADVMTRYIENWANAGGASTGGRAIVLTAPTDRDISNSRNFPADYTSFENTIYPILVANCSGCHSPVGTAGRQQPYFAYDDGDASTIDDVISSYEAAQPKIDLNDGDITPVNTSTLDLFNTNFVSRLYEKDPDDPTIIVGHNCWSGNCENDALEMATAVWNFANGITPTVVDPSLITSRALIFAEDCEASGDCVVASGGNRYENNQIALWEFNDGEGATQISETGGVLAEPLILDLSDDYDWVGSYGVRFNGGRAQDVNGRSYQLNDRINPAAGGSGEFSIEAWVVPDNVTQEDANIISYSGGDGALRNFTLGQTMYNYDYLQLSTTTPDPINDVLSTPAADEVLQATQQHVVTTFDPVNGRRIYVNGVLTNAIDSFAAGSLADWDDTYAFVLGNEVSNNRPWAGTLRLVSIHDRALTHQQIVQNFEVGVGEKYFLLFGIGHIAGIPADSYIMFEVSQFDSYSYLFYKPTFINLDPGVTPNGIAIQGLRIGVNGSVPTVGQAYSKLDTTIDSSVYTAEEGQVLSTLGTIIPLERGPAAPNPDEFFLTFELLGTESQPYIEPAVTAPPLIEPVAVPDIGFRTFEEISASMSAMTGIATTNPAVRATYNTYIQQLPSIENIEGFLPSHQMAIAQLALTYCSELVDNNGDTYFAPFDFAQPAGSAFDTPLKRQQVLDPLMQRMLNMDPANSNLVTQPDETEMRDLLSANGPQSLLGDSGPADDFDSLITTMTQCLPGCNTTARTREIVKASCAAVLGSAATMVQ